MLSVLIALVCTAAPARAYPPEELLARSLSPDKTVDISTGQKFNPFSELKLQTRSRTDVWEDTALPRSGADLNVRRTEVLLKLTPKGFFEAREYSRFTDSLRHESEISRTYVQALQLKSGYTLMIKAARAKEEVEIARDWRHLQERSRRLGALQARRSAKEAIDIFNASLSADKTADIIIDINSRAAEVGERIGEWKLKASDLDTDGLIGPAEIAKRLDQLGEGRLSAEKLTARLETDRAQTGYAYEKKRHLVDGFEVGVIESEGDKALRFGVTLNLWFLANNDIESQKDRVRLIEMEALTPEKIKTEAEKIAGLYSQLKDKIAFFQDIYLDPLPRVESTALLHSDPLLANEVEHFRMRRRERILALSEEIRLLYVDLLFERRVLSDQPRVNHLAKSKKVF